MSVDSFSRRVIGYWLLVQVTVAFVITLLVCFRDISSELELIHHLLSCQISINVLKSHKFPLELIYLIIISITKQTRQIP